MNWIDEQPEGYLFTTSVTQAEILYGVESMPEGKRRSALREETNRVFSEDFAGRVLPFDSAAAVFMRASSRVAAGRGTQFSGQMPKLPLLPASMVLQSPPETSMTFSTAA